MPKRSEEVVSRRYRSARRERQAGQTRVEILASAAGLFAQNGWTGTTLAAIADQAEVAVETIYTSFKSKKVLLQAAMDFAIAGNRNRFRYWTEIGHISSPMYPPSTACRRALSGLAESTGVPSLECGSPCSKRRPAIPKLPSSMTEPSSAAETRQLS